MRASFPRKVVWLLLPLLCLTLRASLAQETGWRPTRTHSTIDRSELPQSAEPELTPVGFESETADFYQIESPEYFPADGRNILQMTQSPEVGPIISPIPPEPMGESYFPPGIDPSQPCPDCFDDSGSWINRKSTSLTATWLPAGDNEIGWIDFDLRTKLTFAEIKNLTITPGIQMHFIDGPTRTDLPAQLYNTQVELRWKQQVSRPFWFEVALTPGVYSDFQISNSDAFRLKAQGLAFFAFSYETQVVAGLYYLDRFDIDFLPIFGLIHSPREDIKLNLVFPAPKVAKRVWQGGWGEEWWMYLAGEFGGGSWAVERVPGLLPGGRRKDQIAYRDWRLMLGLERKIDQGSTMFVEAGYVFNRELEYDSGRGDFDPDSTVMLRAGFSY